MSNYEKPDYPLEKIEHPRAEVSFHVERMKLSKTKPSFDATISSPCVAFPPRPSTIASATALEWVIDQYRVSTDPRSGIVNDPNRDDDEKYILRLIGQVITVSLETQQIIAAFPSLKLGEPPA